MAKNAIIKSIEWRKSLGQFQFRLRGANNKTVAASERYKNRSVMMKVIARWNDAFKVSVPVFSCTSKWKRING